jgi:hypothetical protein
MDLVYKWWKGHDAALQARREKLSAAALAAPDDVALQAEIAEEIGQLLELYKAHLTPVMVRLGEGQRAWSERSRLLSAFKGKDRDDSCVALLWAPSKLASSPRPPNTRRPASA